MKAPFSALQEGDRVRVVIEGSLGEYPAADMLTIATDNGGQAYLELRQPGIVVEQLMPAGFPGKPGCVWIGRNGEPFFTVGHPLHSDGVALLGQDSRPYEPDEVVARHSPIRRLFVPGGAS